MKRHLVICLFILSFLANSTGIARVLLTNPADRMQAAITQQVEQMPTKISEHCHQLQVTQALLNLESGMVGEACDSCFAHCGGALLTAELPNFVSQPQFLVSSQPHYYTPLFNSSFLRPPQVS